MPGHSFNPFFNRFNDDPFIDKPSPRADNHPQRSSSLSAVDYPHGPSNSPEKNTNAPDDKKTPEPRLSDSSTPNINEPLRRPSPMSLKNAFVVAIGGCTSSGKSDLAVILSEVFTSSAPVPVSVPASTPVTAPTLLGEVELNTKDDDTPSKETEGKDKTEHVEETQGAGKITEVEKKGLVVFQNHFFIPKALQPVCIFRGAGSITDNAFMKQSIKDSDEYMYKITSGGSRRAVQKESLSHGGDSSKKCDPDNQGSASSASTLPNLRTRYQEDSKKSVFIVSGPDADLDTSLDFVSMATTVETIKDKGTANEYLKRFQPEIKAEGHKELIAKLREQVAVFVENQAILNAEARFSGFLLKGPIENDHKACLRPVFAFVEGFLTLASPEAIAKSGSYAFKAEAEKWKVWRYVHRLESLYVELAATAEIAEELSGEIEVVKAQLDATLLHAKHHMQGLFDLKLFLSVTKSTAKDRRMKKPMYLDASEGERLPGKMWCSEGYFEGVAWPHFTEAHDWLLEGRKSGRSDKEGDVWVQPFVDATAEETAEWAVMVMLKEMGRLESEAREAARGYLDARD